MKTTKLILAIAFFAFSTMVFSQSLRPEQNEQAPNNSNLSVCISLKAALQNPTILKAMKAQLDPSFLDGPFAHQIYTVHIKLPKLLVEIWGTRTEWKNYFNGHIYIDRRDT